MPTDLFVAAVPLMKMAQTTGAAVTLHSRTRFTSVCVAAGAL
jgi:hypothetical protein